MIFISELTSPEGGLKVLQEQKVDGGWKVKFECCVQTMDDVNNNKRMYPAADLREGFNRITPRIQSRKFVGELDHPIDTGSNMQRQVVVLYKEASHVITKYWFSGNEVMCHAETLGTPNGRIMTELIKDNIPVGFSVRALGNLKRENSIDVITKPIYIITYDCVSDPSHTKAVFRNSLNESSICIGGTCFDKGSYDSFIEYEIDKTYASLLD